MIHRLKCAKEYYCDVRDDKKLFECRKDDRNFQVGDYLALAEYDQLTCEYSGEVTWCNVTYKLENFEGLLPGWCILGVKTIAIHRTDDYPFPALVMKALQEEAGTPEGRGSLLKWCACPGTSYHQGKCLGQPGVECRFGTFPGYAIPPGGQQVCFGITPAVQEEH